MIEFCFDCCINYVIKLILTMIKERGLCIYIKLCEVENNINYGNEIIMHQLCGFATDIPQLIKSRYSNG